jgi:hypothetical protein|tara:strand:+ start:356 stop:463 length:108 start_codon:yes stop_codon:yes gene_type:complete
VVQVILLQQALFKDMMVEQELQQVMQEVAEVEQLL